MPEGAAPQRLRPYAHVVGRAPHRILISRTGPAECCLSCGDSAGTLRTCFLSHLAMIQGCGNVGQAALLDMGPAALLQA